MTEVYSISDQVQAEQHRVRAFTAQNNWPVGGILQEKPDCQISLRFKLVTDLPLLQRALNRDFVQRTNKKFLLFLSSYFNTISGINL